MHEPDDHRLHTTGQVQPSWVTGRYRGVEPDGELTRLLSLPEARVLAFEPSGTATVPLPRRLRTSPARVLTATAPLDVIGAESLGRAVAAFQRALMAGHGRAQVVAADGRWCRLDVVDARDADDCLIAVLTPSATPDEQGPGGPELVPLICHLRLDHSGTVVEITEAFTRMLGWTADEVVGRSTLDIVHPDDHETGLLGWIDLLERPEQQVRVRQRLRHRDGGWVWCEFTDTNHLADPDLGCVVSEIVDVSAEMAAHRTLERRERLLDRLSRALPSGVLHLDTAGSVAVCNDAWTLLTGLSADAGADALVGVVVERDEVTRALGAALRGGADADLDVTFTGTGTCRFGRLHLRPLRNQDGSSELLLTLDDVTRLRTQELDLADQARRDPLTGCLNRRGIELWISQRLVRTLADGHQVAPDDRDLPTVVFVDLDRFKQVNDTRGHQFGDRVLQRVAADLGLALGADGEIGRFGGDEFVVVLDAVDDASRAAELVLRFEAAIAELAAELELALGATFGVARATVDDDVHTLIGRADAAMYANKPGRGLAGGDRDESGAA